VIIQKLRVSLLLKLMKQILLLLMPLLRLILRKQNRLHKKLLPLKRMLKLLNYKPLKQIQKPPDKEKWQLNLLKKLVH
jgi:hypothetical protein